MEFECFRWNEKQVEDKPPTITTSSEYYQEKTF